MASYELENDTWIAGDYNIYEFIVSDYDSPDEAVDLTTFLEIRWILFRYGDSETPVLNLLGEVDASDHAKFSVNIESEYTRDLKGLFVHQPLLIDSNGREFRPAQGVVNMISRGKGENSQFIQNVDKGKALIV